MKEIAIGKIKVESITIGSNFRKAMDKAALKELTENVKKYGVLEPIITRRVGKDTILVAGARRLAAAQEAGIKEIPARVMECTEEEAMTMQALENLHREALNPIDEAEQFDKLIKGAGKEKELAANVSKNLKYIHRALALLNLPKQLKEWIRKGTLKPEHGHLFTRVPESKTEKVMEEIARQVSYYGSEYPVQQLRTFINGLITKDLQYANFDTKACDNCNFCSKSQNMLFDNAGEARLCDNNECFQRKTDEANKAIADKLAEKQFKGQKFLGAKTNLRRDYMKGYTKVGKGILLEDEHKKNPVIAKALKENRDKFGFILEGKEAKLVITDKELLKQVTEKKNSAPEVDWELENFVKETKNEIILNTFKKTGFKPDEMKEMLGHVFQVNIREESIEAITGIKDLTDKKFMALDMPTIIKILWWDNARQDHHNGERYVNELMPKIKDDLKKAEELARKQWPEEKAKREAAKAKAPTTSKAETNEEDGEEDNDQDGE